MALGRMLDLYTDFLISSDGLRTATGMSAMLDGMVSHDQVTRFLGKADYDSRTLWKEIKPIVRQIENNEGVLIVDDTIEEKPYTDENEIICWHFDHVSGHNVKGINLVTLLVRYGDIAIPVAYDIVRKDQIVKDEVTGKERRISSRTKNEMFRDMVAQCIKNQVKFNHVLADSWFSSKENMEFVLEQKKHFIFAMKSNRTIAVSKEDKRQGKFQQVSNVMQEQDQPILAHIKGLKKPVFVVKQVFTNEDESKGILYLACSDVTLDKDSITTLYQKRWRIEEYHKSIKSNTGLEKSPAKTVRTQQNHVFATLCAYVKLEMVTESLKTNHFALKYKLMVKACRAAWAELNLIRQNQGQVMVTA